MRLTSLPSLCLSLSLPLLLGQAGAVASSVKVEARQDPGGQQIAIASYINPRGDPAAWDRLLSYDVGKVSILVANILNGPDYIADGAWKAVINKAASQGRTIVGYVRTGYLGVSKQRFTTRLGSSQLAEWVSQIEQDVDKWYELYGSSLGGIFFDEGWPECGPNSIYVNTYAHINNYVKRKYPGAFTVLNPGSPIAKCYEPTMDALLTFESNYGNYSTKFVPNDWVPSDPRKIWHIVYRVPEDKIGEVAELARQRHAGLIQITDADNPNPYDKLPKESYMNAVMAAVPGGKPNVSEPAAFEGEYVPGLPLGAEIDYADYSSVKLRWSYADKALGYGVYMNGDLVLELPASLLNGTVGGIPSGTKDISFEVRARMPAGSTGGSPRVLTASTLELPANEALRDVRTKTNTDGTVTYSVDVLVPFAFVRLFLTDDNQFTTTRNGWPILYKKEYLHSKNDAVAVANYMFEGNDFYTGIYNYTGSWNRLSTTNAPWSWGNISTANQTIRGYTYSWTFKIQGYTADWQYQFQGQGYAPTENLCARPSSPATN